MGRVQALAALLLTVALAIGQEAPVPNLVANGSFEQLTDAGQATGWEVKPSAADAVAIDNVQCYAGHQSLRVRQTAGVSTAQQTCRPPAARQLLVCWVKREGQAAVRCAAVGPAGQILAEVAALPDEPDWQVLRAIFNPGEVGQVTIRLTVDGPGTVWLDEMLLVAAEHAARVLPAERPATGRNLALHKPYSYSPAPAYDLCTDPDDVVQLTDGVYTKGHFWSQKSTVGWLRQNPQVTIDLGRVEAIDGMAINVAGGGWAGVMFPVEFRFYVSDDDEHYHLVATLHSDHLVQDKKKWYLHQFVADGLKTRGRYAMIEADRGSSTLFCDEIEVYAGTHDPARVAFTGQPLSKHAAAWLKFGLTPDSYQLATSPATPHVRWARPLAGGALNAILVAPDENAREFVELAQRLDLNYLPIGHQSYRTKEPFELLWQQEIGARLPAADVMVMSGFYWDSVPAPLIGRIIDRVGEGLGLVVIGPRAVTEPAKPLFATKAPAEPWLTALPLSLVPGAPAKPGQPLALFQCGKGRVAVLSHPAYTRHGNAYFPNFQRGDLDDDEQGLFEYAYALVARAVQWAAGRDRHGLTAVEAAPDKLTVTVAQGFGGTLEIQVRDAFFEVVAERGGPVPDGGGKLEYALPELMHGAHPVDVRLRDAQGAIVDWASTSFRTERATRLEEVKLGAELSEVGAPLRVDVTVAGPAAGHTVEAVLQDTYGRVTHRAAAAAAAATAVNLATDRCLTLALELLVTLKRGPEVVDRRFLPVWVRLPVVHDEYQFCAWYSLDAEPAATHATRLVRDFGVDTVVSLTAPWRYQSNAYSNVRFGPENVYRVVAENRDGPVRQPCLTDPATITMVKERIKTLCGEGRRYGSVEISMGDESSLGSYGGGHDFCQSPTCLAGFRDYLKRQYGTVAALNREWDTSLKDFAEATPWTREQVAGQDNLARWLDHRRYMETVFADFHAMCRDEILKFNPEARVGMSGTPSPNSYSGHDWVKLMAELTHLSGYGGVQREMQRSLRRDDAFVTSFTGYDYSDDNEQRARSGPWDMLFNGSQGLNYYTLISNTLNCPLIRPDLSLMRKAAFTREEIAAVKAGPARLVLNSTREHDGLAILYSQPSLHAATMTGLMGPQEPLLNYGNNLTAVGDILRDLQVQYDFVSPEQLAAGQLSGYRAVLLLWNQCLSASEAAALERFVEAGGTVIADLLPAIRDEHGKPAAGLGGRLFPAERRRRLPAVTTGPVKLTLGGATLEAPMTISAETGAPVRPAVKTLGKGRAILLDGCATNYSETRLGGAGGEVEEKKAGPEQIRAEIRAFWRGLLAAGGVKAGVELGDAPGVEAVRYGNGPAQLVGLLDSGGSGAVTPTSGRRVTLRLPAAAHLYDCRAGRYLGQTDRHEITIVPGLAGLYACLPTRPTGLKVDAAAVRVGEPLRLRLGLAAAAPDVLSVVRVEVAGPDGRPRPWYAANAVIRGATGQATVPLALNDPPGEWRLTARDVATGLTAQARVTVR